MSKLNEIIARSKSMRTADITALLPDHEAEVLAALREEQDCIIGNLAKSLFPNSPKDSAEAEFFLDATGACQVIERLRSENAEYARNAAATQATAPWVWVPVTERLPFECPIPLPLEPESDCYVVLAGGKPHIAYFGSYENVYGDMGFGWFEDEDSKNPAFINKITHWHEIGASPEGKP